MPINFDLAASNAVFCLPDITGKFDDRFYAYLRSIGAKRPLVMFAFPPKAAGTFLRAAAVEAIDGQMMRVTHAQGGRDATPYLPIFILYFAGGFPTSTMVTHLHMQALPANRFLIDALNLKPVVMLRDVPDMLVSYWEMLEGDQSSDNWVNCQLPANFTAMSDDDKADFLIDILAPWYASYFATWLSYAEEAPDRVCVLRYRNFLDDPAGTLLAALRHAGIEQSRAECQRAIDVTWQERNLHRFNRGVEGRGHARFKKHHLARLETMLFRHYGLAKYRDALLSP